MSLFQMSDILRRQQESGKAYLEFLRVPALSMGVYALPARGPDRQNPHREDEVYYVLAGRALIRIGEQDHPVRSGSLIFVEPGVRHYFHSIREDLQLLVFFAPAEGTRAEATGDEPPPQPQ